jgi:diaminohydroxyphosphoribosylaminopyrimidine deaminase/5-amino-6-(5-phosphoribosylamino)uracil reductase
MHMRHALELAWRAVGSTRPNPIVGAVVVSEGDVVGSGYHRRCGGPHAEVPALEAAGNRARGATMYVTLEPCAHQGRTPPCVDAVIASGVGRVVVAMIDPDPRVAGLGVERMREAGITVDVGCLAPEAIAHNLGYLSEHLGATAAVTLKVAVTMDGKIAAAPGRRYAITGMESLGDVHRIRSAQDCVVVGVDTAIIDSPRLDCRYLDEDRCPPVPVVLDTHLRCPADNAWAWSGRSFIVICGPDAQPDRRRTLEAAGATVVACRSDAGRVDVRHAVERLAQMGLRRILVEGGAGVFSSFVDAAAWDALYLYQAPTLFGETGVPLYRGDGERGIAGRLVDTRRFGRDTRHRFIRAESLDRMLTRLGG